MPLVEKLKREKEKVATLIEGFRAHCKATNAKPTKWEETLSEALRESNQMMQNVGTKVDQLRLHGSSDGSNLIGSYKPQSTLTTSFSQSR